MSTADTVSAITRILDSALPFEQKLSSIGLVLRAGAADPDRLAPRPGWRRDDDPDITSHTLNPRSSGPHQPHRTEPEP